MLFNSYQFILFFFPIVTILYFLLPHKLRWLHLLIASCYFYMSFIPIYITILFATIIIDYFAGILIEKAEGKRRRLFLAMSIVANVGVLAFFKYFNFFAENVNFLFNTANNAGVVPLLKIILPIGLSFHTFQAMSYTIEVYRGNQKAERHFGIYSLYVMFYPQLVAGPIERPQNILHQIHEKHEFSYDNLVNGLRQILWGMFKKAVIADRIALLVNPVFNAPHGYSPISLVTCIFLFAYQIYCDFSGYSDIALGTAKVMGFDLMTNFNIPYYAKSISEFWKRWHISLSTWFNDYLYTPLATSMRNLGIGAVMFGLLFTFFISGLWHGAAWHYVIWGGIHGIALVYEMLTRKTRKKIFKNIPKKLGDTISVVCTFTYVCMGYIFFRANTTRDAIYIVNKVPHAIMDGIEMIKTRKMVFRPGEDSISLSAVGVCFFWIFFLEIIHKLQRGNSIVATIGTKPRMVRWCIYYLFVFLIVFLGVFDQRQFIYFQF